MPRTGNRNHLRVTLRLYKRYDLDLIYLANHDDFSLPQVAKNVLTSFTRGRAFKIDLPKKEIYKELADNDTTYMYVFDLDREEDADVIELLQKVKTNQRNPFIKNLVRSYMVCANIEAYIEDSKITSNHYKKAITNNDIVSPIPKQRGKKSGKETADAILKRRIEKKEKTAEDSAIKPEIDKILKVEYTKPNSEEIIQEKITPIVKEILKEDTIDTTDKATVTLSENTHIIKEEPSKLEIKENVKEDTPISLLSDTIIEENEGAEDSSFAPIDVDVFDNIMESFFT